MAIEKSLEPENRSRYKKRMLIIAGISPKIVVLDNNPRRCPACGLVQTYLKRSDSYLSLFFIPIFRVKKGETRTAVQYELQLYGYEYLRPRTGTRIYSCRIRVHLPYLQDTRGTVQLYRTWVHAKYSPSSHEHHQ